MTDIEKSQTNRPSTALRNYELWQAVKNRLYHKAVPDSTLSIIAGSAQAPTPAISMAECRTVEVCADGVCNVAFYNREVKVDDAAAKTAFQALVDRSQIVEGWCDEQENRRLSNISEDQSIFDDFAGSFIPSHRLSDGHHAVLTDLEENEQDNPSAAPPIFTNMNEIEADLEARRDSKTIQTVLKYSSSTESSATADGNVVEADAHPGSPIQIVNNSSPTITVSRIGEKPGSEFSPHFDTDIINKYEMQV